MIQAVIFDMDGVLVDSEPVYFAANQRLFAGLGIRVDAASYARFVGLDANLMWSALKQENGLQQSVPELVRMEADGMLKGLLQADLQPMAGAEDLLAGLREKGMRLAVASSSSRAVIATVLSKLGLSHFFPVTVSGEQVAHGKPAPDIFLETAKELGVAAQHCLVIEDSAAGVRAARAAGMLVAGFSNPGSGEQDLSAAERVIESLSVQAISGLFYRHGNLQV